MTILVQEDCAAANNSFRIPSRSVRLNSCCFCCSMILPEIEHRQQGTCNAAASSGSEPTKEGALLVVVTLRKAK